MAAELGEVRGQVGLLEKRLKSRRAGSTRDKQKQTRCREPPHHRACGTLSRSHGGM